MIIDNDLIETCLMMSKVAYLKDDELTAEYSEHLKTHGFKKGSSFHSNSGLDLITAKNDKYIIVAFRGTTNLKDWWADFKLLLPFIRNGQAYDAINYVRDLRRQNPRRELIITGHSLGGALAQIVSVMLEEVGIEHFALTFNAAGAKQGVKRKYRKKGSKIINFVLSKDPLYILSKIKILRYMGPIWLFKDENLSIFSSHSSYETFLDFSKLVDKRI